MNCSVSNKLFLKFIFVCTAMFGFVSATNAQVSEKQDKYAQCLEKSSSEWGSNCGSCYNSAKSYRVNLKNVCTDKLDVKVAVQERSNRWKTFNQTNLAPGDSVSGYACEGTGKYVFWTRKAGDNTTEFPTEEEIEKEFTPKK